MTPSSAAPQRTDLPTPPPRPVPLRAVPPVPTELGSAGGGDADIAPVVGAGQATETSGWSGLPDPAPLATNLARCVFEILAGARDIEQIARWVSDDVYRHLLKRVVLATRARSARGESAQRPSFSVGSVRLTEPSAGVVEAVVVIHGRARSRAVALRLDVVGSRWRATAIHVL